MTLKWLNKLERKYGRYAIKGLMTYIVGVTGFVFILGYVYPMYLEKLTLNFSAITRGEVWRLITYIFIPDSLSILWLVFSLILYYMIGNQLESHWGSFKFNVYYFIGMLGTTIAVLLTGGQGTATFLNLSLFLAFAHLYPDYELVIYFVLPVKMKYLAWLIYFYMIITIIGTQPAYMKAAALVSLLNYFLFFGADIIRGFKNRKYATKNKIRYKSQMPRQVAREYIHKCSVCGLTDKEDPSMDFRYCPDCDGRHAYCKEHIFNHEHIKVEKVIEFPNKKNEP